MGRGIRREKPPRPPQRSGVPSVDPLAEPEQGGTPPAQTVSHSKDCGLSVSVTIWFLILLYGLLPLSSHPKAELVLSATSPPKYAPKLGPQVSTAGLNLTSYSDHRLGLDYHSIIAQIEAVAACKRNASRKQSGELFPCRQGALHPQLANLVDLCPCLEADSTGKKATIGHPYLCDDSHYRLPCPERSQGFTSETLAKFTSVCRSSRACRRWWMRQHAAVGVCDCPSFSTPDMKRGVTSFAYLPPSKALLKPADVAPAQSPLFRWLLALLVPIGKQLLP